MAKKWNKNGDVHTKNGMKIRKQKIGYKKGANNGREYKPYSDHEKHIYHMYEDNIYIGQETVLNNAKEKLEKRQQNG